MALGAFNHLSLTVTDMARAEKYYDRLLGFLGYQQAEKSDEFILWAGQHGGITLSPANPDSPNKTHDRYSPGLHHFAFNADSREDVDRLYQFLLDNNIEVLDAPAEYDYMEGYYAVFFADPDGMKLELAHITSWPAA